MILNIDGTEIPVGTLAWSMRDRIGGFEFDASFRMKGLEISPIKLPTKKPFAAARKTPFEGLHGVFADSLPDGWGRLLADRFVRASGGDPSQLTPLDRPSLVGTKGMGALVYRPSSDMQTSAKRLGVDLDALAADASAVLDGREARDIEALIDANGGSAGARPKVLILRNKRSGTLRLDVGQASLPEEEAWLVKFRSRADPVDMGRIERAYALMAREAGINFPDTDVLEGGSGNAYFAAKRFDRQAGARRHVHTLAGLLDADHTMPSVEYEHFLAVTKILTERDEQVEEAYGRMTFNVIARNRDDHAKNHAFAMSPSGEWSLSGAYDVNPSSGPGGEHALAVAGEGRSPTRRHLRHVAQKASITEGRAAVIEEGVVAAILSWPRHAESASVSEAAMMRTKQDLDKSLQTVLGAQTRVPNRVRRQPTPTDAKPRTTQGRGGKGNDKT